MFTRRESLDLSVFDVHSVSALRFTSSLAMPLGPCLTDEKQLEEEEALERDRAEHERELSRVNGTTAMLTQVCTQLPSSFD
jgi:hypothetical protein